MIVTTWHVSLVQFGFEFCPREANAVAHELASIARSKFCSEWIEMAPNELLPLLLKDVSVITNE